MRREVLSVVAILVTTACGSPAPQKDKDVKAPALEPAVVNAPLDVPTPVVATTPKKLNIIPEDQVARNSTVLQGYSLATATMINHDARMLAQIYQFDAVFHAPDSTVKGGRAVVQYLVGLAQSKSLADWQRITNGQRIIDDSTLVDSGLYRMILKRSAKDSTIQEGRYKTTWRARTDISKWVILEDAITPGAAPKKRAAK